MNLFNFTNVNHHPINPGNGNNAYFVQGLPQGNPVMAQNNIPNYINPIQIYQPQNNLLVRNPRYTISVEETSKRKASDYHNDSFVFKTIAFEESCIKYTLKNNVAEGPAKQIFNDGQILEFTFKNGKKEGAATENSTSSDIKFIFKNGKREGPAREMLNSGVLEFTFKNVKKKAPQV